MIGQEFNVESEPWSLSEFSIVSKESELCKEIQDKEGM
jgi:hypothetical protein